MKRIETMICRIAIALAIVLASSWNVNAQQQNTVPATKASAAARIIGFRATSWKTIHAHSDDQAQQIQATLKKLGCEVNSEQHDGHIDVSYRCPEWKSMKLDTDDLVNRWAVWCEQQGMETVVVNPPGNSQKPTVQFRMVQAKTVHLHDSEKARKIINTLSLVGCQMETNQHDDHLDVTFSAPEWVTIELISEDSAHAWQKWLDDSGFETQHTHAK